MSKYWTLHGPLAEKIKGCLTRRQEAIELAEKIAKRVGAKLGFFQLFNSTDFSFQFETNPGRDWRKCSCGDGWYDPSKSTKAGKALEAEKEALREMCRWNPSVADLVGMETYRDGMWNTPGLTWTKAGPLFLKTPDYYDPPKRLEKQIVRSSDLEYEAAVKPKKRKRNARE